MEECENLLNEFLERFPLESLKTLSIDDYVLNGNENNFCWWLEYKTKIIGNISGGTSFNHGIYKKAKNVESTKQRYSQDDFYAWYSKYGKTSSEAFEKVRTIVYEIAKAATDGNYVKVDEIEFSQSAKMKIAFMYSNKEMINIFKGDAINFLAKTYNLPENIGLAEKSHRLVTVIAEKDFWSSKLWEEWENSDECKSKKNNVKSVNDEENLEDENMENVSKIDTYINLLKSNHNIILHGAPGTGKTYLAKEIAKAMGAEEDNIGFVQFHPSYDYTDFVEGLRPKNGDDGQIGFERKDGVFKEFCKRAVKSIKNSESQVDNFDESWKNLVDYLNENDNMDISLLSGKGTFPIELNEYGTGLATRTYMDETREDWISGKSKFFSKDQLYNIYKGLPGVPMGGHDNYRKAIVKTMKEKFGLLDYDASQASIKALDFDSLNFEEKKEVIKRYLISNTSIYIDKDFWSNPVKILRDKESFSFQLPVEKGNGIHDLNFEDIINAKKNDDNKILQYTILNNAKNSYIPKNIRKNFIFIIDEINRGEISKIFGELFFSIDPGYRGEKGLVQTQYQNLVEEGDIFKKGFFIPENVYIIGTMNDIDRSVESMDFAMRRRFVFKEITADQSAKNMNLGDEAKRRMTALNEEISKIDGLGSSYHIGAAYFLKEGKPISEKEDFDELWELRLESLLKEYLRGTGNESKLKDLKDAYEKGESDSGSDE